MHCHLILQAAAIFNAQSLRLGRGLGRHVVVFYIENLEAPLGYGSKFPMSQPLTRFWHGPFMGSKQESVDTRSVHFIVSKIKLRFNLGLSSIDEK